MNSFFRRLRRRIAKLTGRDIPKKPVGLPLVMKGRAPYDKYDIGDLSYGNPKVLAWENSQDLKIGKFCSIAADVTILLGGEHDPRAVSTFPFGEFLVPELGSAHEFSKGDVVIGNDVWIGRGATILSGVNIGNGAIIAAGSLVHKDVEPYQIVGGNPAKPLRQRFSDNQIAALQRISWWDWPQTKIEQEAKSLIDRNISDFISRHDS